MGEQLRLSRPVAAVPGDRFVVRFKMDMTIKASGERRSMDEVGLYTIRNVKIAEERFFHGG